jgi:hypothetical protein
MPVSIYGNPPTGGGGGGVNKVSPFILNLNAIMIQLTETRNKVTTQGRLANLLAQVKQSTQ